MSDLFRKEVMERRHAKIAGDLIIARPVETWIVTWTIVLLACLAVVILAAGSFKQSTAVQGWLVPDKGLVRAIAKNGGTVERVLVSLGDSVGKGDPIAVVNLSVSTQNGDAGQSLLRNLEQQERAAIADFTAQSRLLELDEERLKAQLENRKAQLNEVRGQIRAQEQRLKGAQDLAVWAQENFEEGLTTRADMEARKDNVLALTQERITLRRSITSLRGEVSDIEGQLQAIPQRRAENQASFDSSVANFEERRYRTTIETEYILVSPIDGRVEVVAVEVGQSLAPSATAAVILPNASELLAEMYIPSEAVGFIQPGQTVEIDYGAFPKRRFGAAGATLTEVSRAVLTPEEVMLPGGRVNVPTFRARAQLSNSTIVAYGSEYPLRSGMEFTARVVIEERSLLEWLLDPILAAER